MEKVMNFLDSCSETALLSKLRTVSFQYNLLLKLRERMQPYVDSMDALFNQATQEVTSVRYGQGCFLNFGYYDPFVFEELVCGKHPRGRLFYKKPTKGVFDTYGYDKDNRVIIHTAEYTDHTYCDIGGNIYLYEGDCLLYLGYDRSKEDKNLNVGKYGISKSTDTLDYTLTCYGFDDPKRDILDSLFIFKSGTHSGKAIQCSFSYESGMIEHIFQVEFDQKMQPKDADVCSRTVFATKKQKQNLKPYNEFFPPLRDLKHFD